MRRAAKIDANHREIVDALRQIGATVQSLAAVGAGVPDLLVGFRGMTHLLEVKDGSKPPSARKLTIDQIRWHGEWCGSDVYIVTCVDDALKAIGITERETCRSQN
jgi:Holliday junction resolvase